MVVIGASGRSALYLKSRLGPSRIDVVAVTRVEELEAQPFIDAIVLDGGDLVDATATVRRATAAPLLAIGRDERVAATCLAIGADAWLPEECALSLIAAQVEALLRRRAPAAESTPVEIGELQLDPAARRAVASGKELQLAPREFDLLNVLVRHHGVALTRDRILAAAWDTAFVGEQKTVDVHIAWLRQKLEGTRLRITTLRGVGYRLDVLAPATKQVEPRIKVDDLIRA
ncbi:MAG TPA: response regulator transcription factor [Candidatus Dormibacteraeota bacterium]|nr:response regulator transcription factor [Candidatus Dormibacteraeota bacterium]